MTRYTADQSAALMTIKLLQAQPFIFLRFGDGVLECVSGKEGGTRDGEPYSLYLAAKVCEAWTDIRYKPNVYLGDWQSASFDAASEYARYRKEYTEFTGWSEGHPNWLHFEALLLMRQSHTLIDFYRTVALDGRRKAFMGPRGNAGAVAVLKAGVHIETPMDGLLWRVDELQQSIERVDPEVLLFGAGMAGNIPVMRWWKEHQDRTVINLGSAMDPLFRGRSRSQQLSPQVARVLFEGLL